MGKRKTPRGELPATAEGFATALLAAARAGDDARWLAPGFELPAELARGAELAAQPLVGRARRGGWPPEDLRQAASRRVDEFAGSYVLDALAEADGVRWWTGAEPHLAQWAAKHILTPAEAVTAVVEALGLLLTLPVTAAQPRPAAPHGVDDKKLSRVRALLAKAESTSFPEEAEALSAKAQELMTRHALDRVLLEAAPALPSSRRIWLDTPYTDAKSLLVHVVAKANRCRAVYDPRWEFVTVVGDEEDLDAVALLTTSLLVQATRAMIADPAGRSRPFRKSFLVSYATRIGERLEQAAAATLTELPGADRLLPVLASHELRVNTAFATLFPEVVGKSVTVRSAEGWHAGRSAADRARFGE
ncbi:DUF2786 domain-containing protein [Amycolatopsis sp. CA-128772]|uniref:DUF2786 domain-containing protein n=1 Tax=Amycolatopsis sp. CA-128772 TaxID=2073159 RepID=UPI000CD12FAD|nr:DUF2786 domain-containing protein [Amycolatopsis sp. CA-128772]